MYSPPVMSLGALPSGFKGLGHSRTWTGGSCRHRLPHKIICRIRIFGVRWPSPRRFRCTHPDRPERPWQRIIRGDFSAYVDWPLSVIVKTVPRTLKPAGDGEIWHYWQCAGSLPPLPNPLTPPKPTEQSHGYFTDGDMRSPCLAGFTPARPRPGGRNENHMSGFANLIPLFIFGLLVYAFFRWVARDIQNPKGK